MSDNAIKIIDMAMKAAVTLVVTAVIAISGILWNQENRITKVEENRFSQADGAVVIQAIADLRKDVAVLNQARNDVDRRLERIENKLDVVVERLTP